VAVAIGNHELYRDSTVSNLVDSGFVVHWGARGEGGRGGEATGYVTSNVLLAASGEPIGSRYSVRLFLCL
jgi:hypothetical protein